jgi:predicted nucleic acid-binding protein
MLVDTNVFLELLLNQAKAADCASFLERIEQGQSQGFVTDFTIHSLAVILERTGHGSMLPQLFASLSAFRGLTVLHASLSEQSDVAAFAIEVGLDFDDGYQAYFAHRMNVPIISYDHHFDGIAQRKEPADFH